VAAWTPFGFCRYLCSQALLYWRVDMHSVMLLSQRAEADPRIFLKWLSRGLYAVCMNQSTL
jgi:hypothetical protein